VAAVEVEAAEAEEVEKEAGAAEELLGRRSNHGMSSFKTSISNTFPMSRVELLAPKLFCRIRISSYYLEKFMLS
jgi:hypothetical protein